MEKNSDPNPLRFIGLFFAVLFVFLMLGPWIIPVPPLGETQSIEALADADSRFIDVNGVNVHYKESGTGEPVIILLHGFGANTFSWREVMEPLSAVGRVIAFDRPAFGLTERPLPGEWQGENPYSQAGQVALTLGLMDALGIERAILVGNSAGGAVAAELALEYPQRVTGLALVDAAIYTRSGAPDWMQPWLDSPLFNKWGPFFTRSLAGEQGQQFLQMAWADPAKITADILAGYQTSFLVERWDEALWQLTKTSGEALSSARMGQLTMPVVVISGAEDQIIPITDSQRLAAEIPGAQLHLLEACGHLPQEECPQTFLPLLVDFAASLTP